VKGNKTLETLPNIDINIKCGNSLISRFDLSADLTSALEKNKLTIDDYKQAVKIYHHPQDKQEKQNIEKLINQIKSNFSNEITGNDATSKKLRQLEGELNNLLNQTSLFTETAKEKKAKKKKQKDLEKEINKLTTDIENKKNNRFYHNAFEWRFEFPEVLNDDGDFIGFDIIIGNPPYFLINSQSELNIIANKYLTFSNTGDIYALFIELGFNLLKSNGIETLIISNKWMRANYGIYLRKYLVENTNPLNLIDFGQNLLFDNAIVHTNILMVEKSSNLNLLNGIRFSDNFFKTNHDFEEFINTNMIKNITISEDIWNILSPQLRLLKDKIETIGKKLSAWNIDINFGIKTGYNEAFIIDQETKNYLIENDGKNEEIIKPILRGRDTRKYYCNYANFWLINSHNGYKNNPRIDLIKDYPIIYQYLLKFEKQASQRYDQGYHWTNLRNCAYLGVFKQPKIIFSEIVSEPQFYYDEKGYYPEATAFFISGDHLKYLTGLLNSKAVTFFFKNFYMGGELVGKIRYKKAFLLELPIPIPDDIINKTISNIVTKILKLKQENPNNNTTKLEREIDLLVYQLYELTEDEINIVEEK
ncbi:Eco57I restriction-modification methylase domain-containing protein, partial [Geminocystis sp. GBBB08]|uniref:Eco57I restriction-modification methylase domain-containing protein n=1 Tax=Geminocystis sp. GBBB08 TaxID=2604140 RepID=UPI0027E279B9